LPVKNAVLFPYLLMPLNASRPGSVAAIEAALGSEEKEIVIVTQRDSSVEEPGPSDLFTIGTKAVIKRMAHPVSSMFEIIVQGGERVVLIRFDQTTPYLQARVRSLPLPEDKGTEIDALYRAILDLAGRAFALVQPQAPTEITQLLKSTQDPLRLVYMLGSMMSIEFDKEQALLEAESRLHDLR